MRPLLVGDALFGRIEFNNVPLNDGLPLALSISDALQSSEVLNKALVQTRFRPPLYTDQQLCPIRLIDLGMFARFKNAMMPE